MDNSEEQQTSEGYFEPGVQTLSDVAPASCKVYTAPILAKAIVMALGDQSGLRWLEPSVGQGVFLTALSEFGVDKARITAVDLDECQGPQDHLANTLRKQDFIRWAMQAEVKFDRIVGNPPYVSLTRLSKTLRDTALSVSTPHGSPITPKTNYWCVFVAAILNVLNHGGSLGLVLPAAWDYADYCAELRNHMPSLFESFEVYRSRSPLFDRVGEGSIVILGRCYKSSSHTIIRTEHKDLEAMVAAFSRPDCNLIPRVLTPEPKKCDPVRDTCLIKEIAEIHIGAVTGHAQYFLLTEAERDRLKLPTKCCKPILTRARHLCRAEVTVADWEQLRTQGERVWLFAPSDEMLDDPAVQAYLNLPVEAGGCNKSAYKVQNRKPWYRVILSGKNDGFLSGMSRIGPWICMNHAADLQVSNTLYTIKFKGTLSQDEKYSWALSMLTTFGKQELIKTCRVYADGLLKHEPKDLLNLRVQKPIRVQGARETYLAAIDALLCGRETQVRDIADNWLDVI